MQKIEKIEIKIRFYVVTILFMISFSCFSQNKVAKDTGYIPSPSIELAGDDIPRPKPIVDTFNFKYRFCVGDTLIYYVMSRDSIIINYGSPLLRIRFEKVMLSCDSVTPSGHFIIKQQLIDFESRESYMKEENVVRNSSPWLNVGIYIEIDSMGVRYKQSNSDSLQLSMPPGGAFQPFILLPLNMKDSINRKHTNETWLVMDSIHILENGSPAPMYRYSLYYRMKGIVDTLDLGKLLKISFSMTSAGSHKVNTADIKMVTTSINNAGGDIFFDTLNWVPKHYTHTIEQRLTISDKVNKTEEPGFHYIYSTFILDKFIRKKQ